MHPMFVKLYLENDADDVLAERRTGAGPRTGPGGPVRARPPGSSLATGTAGPPGEAAIGTASGPGEQARFRSRLAGLRRTGPGRR